MANMRSAIDHQLSRAARVKAVQQGTRVDEVCRQAIEAFAQGAGDADARMARLKALAKKVRAVDAPLSEDFSAGARFDDLLVANPFALAAHAPAPKPQARRR